MIEKQPSPSKKLRFNGIEYTYLCGKKNILLYVNHPMQILDDLDCDPGGAIVVQYRPYLEKNQYLVIHQLVGDITTVNISKTTRTPETVD